MDLIINVLKEFFIYNKCSHEWEYINHYRKSDGEPIPYFRECTKCGKQDAME